ncbi:flagellar hook assembly protein FlgD [Caproiciproducens galactitolivorans]|uniref:Basal-body rod modification protein FlgD n=1 Tax=Caproiciproducens galactitolivorans TaxID=642589 RepID=A0A4Z0YGN1_9FIRM|nr:flagellar hook capping FlgD N-terminal domain-containing protein [Caproiciproducens galactitolivorans]TGJ77893.1 basal-body rod modification protein FlgD [Caproiciproducens galactitolivorans]
MNQIYPYSLSGTARTSINTTSGATELKTGKSSLEMTDFMKLLAAQMANQDPTNPTDNNEFIGQMAQFASLQAMQDLRQLSLEQYGASLVGKKVVVASYDANGKYVEDTGVVDYVNYSSGSPCVVVNGKAYDLYSVMQVNSDTYKSPETSPELTVPEDSN